MSYDKKRRYRIKGIPKETQFRKMSFGQQIEFIRKFEEFKLEAKSAHISQKRTTSEKAIKEFLKLNDVTEYYCTFYESEE